MLWRKLPRTWTLTKWSWNGKRSSWSESHRFSWPWNELNKRNVKASVILSHHIRLSQFPALELDKFLEDVRWAIRKDLISKHNKHTYSHKPAFILFQSSAFAHIKQAHVSDVINALDSHTAGMESIRWLPSVCPAHSSPSRRLSSPPSYHPPSKHPRLSLQSWRPGRWEMEWITKLMNGGGFTAFKNKYVFSPSPAISQMLCVAYCMVYISSFLSTKWVVTVSSAERAVI